VHRFSSARPLHLVTLTVLVIALGVAGCGRKGPLDPPPGASTPAPEPSDALKLSSLPDVTGAALPNG
jgi:predicted small lipoprotein YifL